MTVSRRVLLCTVLCIISLVIVSGCTKYPLAQSNSSPPPLITDVQTGSPAPSVSAPAGGCAEGQTTCSGVCRNTLADSSNCGRCGNTCSASQYCNNGICGAGTQGIPVSGTTTAALSGGITCAHGQTSCSGTCRNLQADAGNCGWCGNVCGSGRVCSSGTCTGGSITTVVTTAMPSPLPDSAAAVTTTAAACGTGLTHCEGSCADLNADTRHCGSCGNSCPSGYSCTGGICTVSCPAGFTACGPGCSNMLIDPVNCGSCGNTCPVGQSCSAGSCRISCPAGYTLCGGGCSDILIDPMNCGACGNTCSAIYACSGGTCSICAGGYTNCGSGCTSPLTDSQNCGWCGNVCPYGESCSGGICTVPACGKGLTRCSSTKGGSACVDLLSDSNNCGYCGHICTTGSCIDGDCTFIIK